MIVVAAENFPRLHVVPLASVYCNGSDIVVELDDENEARVRLTFSPHQAIKMVTSDCFDILGSATIIPQTVMEIQNSPWVYELRDTLKKTDIEADFMDKARHFLLPLGDDFLEIVAWDVVVESLAIHKS